MILDNASAPHADSVRSLGAKSAGRLVVVHLPPYAPELNSIEIPWRTMRRAITNTCSSARAP